MNTVERVKNPELIFFSDSCNVTSCGLIDEQDHAKWLLIPVTQLEPSISRNASIRYSVNDHESSQSPKDGGFCSAARRIFLPTYTRLYTRCYRFIRILIELPSFSMALFGKVIQMLREFT